MKKVIMTCCLLSGILATAFSQTKVIAHRGFWKTDGSAQNSITALVKADSIKCYGSEFDVWLAADDKLVVNHDHRYKGKRMETSTASELTSLELPNGEHLPSLEEYLIKGKELPATKLILELKAHTLPEQETKAIEKIVEMVKRYQLEERMEYISFSLHAVKEFIRLSPNTPVYYLEGDLSPKKLKEIGCSGLDYSMGIIKRKPKWIKEAHKLGLKVNVWTVNKESDMRWLIDKEVDFITTDNPLLLQSILAEEKDKK